jgi:hypothetical protein
MAVEEVKRLIKQKNKKMQELETHFLNFIIELFLKQKNIKSDCGESEGISDELIMRRYFGKKKFSNYEVKLTKKLRTRFQREYCGLVGSRNRSGEYIRYYPKKIEEQQRYNNTRVSVIVGLMKGLVKNNKSNAGRLGVDWTSNSSKLLDFIYNDTRDYVKTGDGDFSKNFQ